MESRRLVQGKSTLPWLSKPAFKISRATWIFLHIFSGKALPGRSVWLFWPPTHYKTSLFVLASLKNKVEWGKCEFLWDRGNSFFHSHHWIHVGVFTKKCAFKGLQVALVEFSVWCIHYSCKMYILLLQALVTGVVLHSVKGQTSGSLTFFISWRTGSMCG